MRKLLFISILLSCVFLSCKTGVYTSQYGKEDVAYISLVSSDQMADKDVDVFVDDTKTTLHVEKAKQHAEKRTGKLFAIKPGKRHLRIVHEGKVVYEKDIFVSSQQTKLINL